MTKQGGVQCWGRNDRGQLGNGTFEDSEQAQDVVGLSSGIVQVAAGGEHTCALTSTGTVKCWGASGDGQAGSPPIGLASLTPIEIEGLAAVVAITAGSNHSCAITSGGAVKCWGNNYYGQLGDGGNVASTHVPVAAIGLDSGVVSIAAGWAHTCVVTNVGALKCWGADLSGQLGRSGGQDAIPGDVDGLSSGVLAVAGGDSHTCAIVQGGSALCWGSNAAGQLGDGSMQDAVAPVPVTGLGGGVTGIAAGGAHSCARLSTGGVRCWGQNVVSQLGNGTRTPSLVPVDVIGLASATAIDAGGLSTCALDIVGTVLCWGFNGAAVHSPIPVDVPNLSGMYAIATGYAHTCALAGNGSVSCWGRNEYGALGIGSNEDSFVPVAVPGLGAPAIAIRAGGETSCALLVTGAVKCWGRMSDLPMQLQPADVPGLSSGIADVQVAGSHACALTAAGAVKCWGYNAYGALGDGTTTSSAVPVDVVGLGSNVVAIGIGRFHSCAILDDGSARCWGDNTFGQLGVTEGVSSPTPVAANQLGPVYAITGGGSHTCAQTTTYGMQCWGSNARGQLGIGSTHSTATPATVPLSTGTLGLALGDLHSCQLGNAGMLRCWGWNASGQLGDGTRIDKLVPTVVGDISGVTSFDAGAFHTCAILGGGVKCWGDNAFGQLGVGTSMYAKAPTAVQVPLCGGFADVETGTAFCRNVDWVRNRMITNGCTADAFCPQATTTRDAMAAFMARTGAALTPVVLSREDEPGAQVLDVLRTVCTADAFDTGPRARSIHLDAVYRAKGVGTGPIDMRFVESLDGGTTWRPISVGSVTGTLRPGHWTNLKAVETATVESRRTVRYGIAVTAGVAPHAVAESTCHLRVRIGNHNGPHAAVDAVQ